MKRFLLFCLLPSCLFAAFKSFCQDTIEIASLPYSLPESDTCYCLSAAKVSATASGINSNVKSNVLITRRVYNVNDSLGFGSSGSSGTTGIYITGGSNYVWIKGITLVHEGTPTDSGAVATYCIYSPSGADYVLIDSCNTQAQGTNAQSMRFKGGYNCEVRGGVHTSLSMKYGRRDYANWASDLITYDSDADYSLGDWSLKVTGAVCTSAAHCAIRITTPGEPLVALGKYLIQNNTLQVDARNDCYSYPPPGGQGVYSSGDAFGIDILGCRGGTLISGNTITSGNQYEGGDGMLLQGCRGTETDSVKVINNIINVHHGPNEIHPFGRVVGIYFRICPGTEQSGNEYTVVRNNSFNGVIDASASADSTTHTGRESELASLTLETKGTGDSLGNPTDVNRHNSFSNNHCVVDTSGTMVGWWRSWVVGIGTWDSTRGSWQTRFGNNRIAYNYYKSPYMPVGCGNTRGLPSNWVLHYGDTINITKNVDSSTIVFNQTGVYILHSRGNRCRDCVFQGYASDTDVVFGFISGDPPWDSLGMTFAFERTLHVPVIGNDSNPIPAALVTVASAYGDTVWSGLTDDNGLIEDVVTYRFYGDGTIPGEDVDIPDSLAYNPFTITASKSGFSADTLYTVSDTTASVTLTLNMSGGIQPHGSLLLIRK